MTVTINLIKTKPVKTLVWKTLNVLVGITTILNVSLVGALLAPTTARAQEVSAPDGASIESTSTATWPSNSDWNIPICNDDPANDENPSSVDLKSSGSSEYGAAYYIDGTNLYLRERVDGNPGIPGDWNQYAWVFMIQKNAATTDYDYLVSLRGSGVGENVELWENTTPNGPIDWSPIFNDPAETQLQTWDTSTNSRRVTTGSDYFVDWQIPLTALTSRGVVVNNGKFSGNHGLFWATATNANNYNKDHLNCYDAPDLRIAKELRKNSTGSYFTDGRTVGVQAAPGDTLNYRVTVTNVGGPTQGTTTVTDELGKNYNDGDGDAAHNVNPSTQYSDWMSALNLNTDGNGNSFAGSWGNGSADGQANDTLTLTVPLISGGGAQEQFNFDGVVRGDLTTGTYLDENTATVGSNSAETDINVVSTPTRVPNPPLGQSCGLDIGLIVDRSGSVSSSEMSDMKTALTNFANAFDGTPTVFSLASFATDSTLNRAFSRTPTQMASDIASDIPSAGNGNTNWDSGLGRSFDSFNPNPRPAKSDLIVIATDGSPNRWGYPSANPTFSWDDGLAHAIDRANAIKTAGTRIVVVGIGDDDFDPATPAQKLQKMKNISGDNVALTPGAITTSTDVIKVTDFTGIGAALSSFANELCGGQILVQKQFDTDGDGIADVTGSSPNDLLKDYVFDVNGSPSNPAPQTTTNTGSLQFAVDAGTYSVVEQTPLPANTKLVSATCNQPDQNVNLETRTVSNLSMPTEGTISCTFVNGYDKGHLIVQKTTDPAADPTVFSISASGTGTITGGGAGTVTDALDKNYEVTPGTYSVTETVPSGWSKIGDTCQDVTVAAGETKYCTLTNTRDTGTIKVNKLLDNDGNDSYETTNPGSFTWSLDGSGTRAMGSTATVTTLDTHTVNENYDAALYDFVGWSYGAPEQVNCAEPQNSDLPANLTVTKDGTTEITLCNVRKTGRLTVHKLLDQDGNPQTPPLEDPQGWTYDIENGEQNIPMGQGRTLITDTYTVNEDQQPNYTAGDWYCTSNNQVVAQGSGEQLTVDVTTDGAECWFTNIRDTGRVTIVKEVIGGDAQPGDWEFTVNGTGGYHSGDSFVLPTADYPIAESGPDGYTLTSVSGVCEQLASAIVLHVTTAGGTCTFTNTRDTGFLTVNKMVDPENDGSFVGVGGDDTPFRWGVDALDGPTTPRYMGATAAGIPTVTPFNVNENLSDVPGYHFAGWYYTNDAAQLDNNLTYNCTNPQFTSMPTGLTVAKNGTTQITLCNARDTGTITVHKYFNDDADENWERIDPQEGWSWDLNPGQQDNLAGTQLTVGTGEYTVSEDPIGNYTSSWNCNNQTFNVGTSIPVNLEDGQDLVCTFYNVRDTGDLTVIKAVDTDGDGDVDQTNADDWTWDLDGGDQNFATGSTQTVVTGNHSVSEDNKDNFHNLNYECRDNESEDVVAEGTGTLIPEVNVTTDGVTCVFTNVRDTGTVTLEKIVVGGTAQPADWNFTIGETPGYHSGDQVTLPTGDYNISEFGPAGYSFDSVSGVCFQPDPDLLTTTPPMGNAILHVTTEGGTCTFTNVRDTGTVKVNKQVDADGNGTFETGNDGANALGFRWSLDGGEANRLMGSSETITTIDNHTVNENTVANFHPVGWFYNNDETSCTDLELNSLPANVTVGKNDTTEITICNARDTGRVTFDKVVTDNPSAESLFAFAVNGSGSYHDSDAVTLPTGSYTVTESAVPGYAFVSASGICALVEGAIVMSVTTDGGTCTVTNRQLFPDLTVTKTDGLTTANPGQQLAYTMVVSNVGEFTADNVTVTDTLPAQATYVSSTLNGVNAPAAVTPNPSGDQLNWNIGSLANGASKTLLVTVALDATFPFGTTLLHNAVTVSTTTTEPNTGNNSASDDTNVSASPTLGLQKSADPTTVPAGTNVNWTVTWSVSGNANATNVVIVDPIPANSTFVSVADGGVYDAVTNKVTWNLGTQSPGASGLVHYVTKTASPITNGTVITNTATIDSAETDPAISASASVTVTSAPDLTIAKTSSVTTFTNPGQPVTYTVTVTNKTTATDTAKNVVLTDTLPSGFTFAVDGTTTKSFTIGDLTPGQSATVTYLVNISGSQTAGTYNNSAKAKGDNTTEVTATTPVEVRVPQVLAAATPDLAISKVVNKSTAKPGDVVTYTITVKNTGDGDAANVVITDTLPKDLSFVHGTGRTMTWEIGTLEAGRSRVVNVDVRVESDAKSGDYENVAAVTADDLPQQQATAKLTVKTPKVLGLATTGAGPLDYFLALLGAALIWAGLLGLKRRQPELAQ